MVYALCGHSANVLIMKETKIKSFEFAADLTKQLITLSTILIAISITFFEKFTNEITKWVLISSWILLFLSLIFGVITLMALTGSLGKIQNDTELQASNIYKKNITFFSVLQIISFILGVLLLITFSSSSKFSKNIETSNNIEIVREVNYKILNPFKSDTLKIKKPLTINIMHLADSTKLEDDINQ